MVTKPVFNLNGTSPESLLEGYSNAMAAVADAMAALRLAAPHGRDYQTAPDGQFNDAQNEHWHRMDLLKTVYREMEQLAEHASDAVLLR